MKKQNHIIAIVVLGIALAVVFVIASGVPWGYRATAPTGKVVGQNPGIGTIAPTSSPLAAGKYVPHPPHGSVTYQIAQAATQLPAFPQATIDPADAAVGQVQHFTIVTNDPNPVTSVLAIITTDHKKIIVPLVSQGAPAVSMLVPRSMYVKSDNMLALIPPGASAPNIAETRQGAHVANAAQSNETEFTGQWTVEDTHSAKYETVFVAQDSAGNQNSVTIQWADPPCSFSNNYSGGTATISSGCSIDYLTFGTSAIDGPENGNLAVTAGTLSINNNNKLAVSNGYHITLSGTGAITLNSSLASIVFMSSSQDMCGTDNDGDGWSAGNSWTIGSSCVSRKSITNGSGDCDDSDANVHPGQTGYFGTASHGGTWDYNCDGTVTAAPNMGPVSSYVWQYFQITQWCFTNWNSDAQQCYGDQPSCQADSINYDGGDYCSAQGYMTAAYQGGVNMSYSPVGAVTAATEDVRYCGTSQGQTQCTPWLSAGGGWSGWTPLYGSADNLNPTVSIQTTTLAAGSVFVNLQQGLQMDENNNMSDPGTTCTAYEEIASVTTSTGLAYGTTYCNGSSLSTTPDQMRVYLSGTLTTVGSSPASTCPSAGGCH